MLSKYSSARLALCHYQILALERWSTSEEGCQEVFASKIEGFGEELRTSAVAITHIVQDLIYMNIAQYLPINA